MLSTEPINQDCSGFDIKFGLLEEYLGKIVKNEGKFPKTNYWQMMEANPLLPSNSTLSAFESISSTNKESPFKLHKTIK